ncbi:hypothetical protein BJ322DRAFT_1113458 [Thelephora terrestris]|uniref:Uncharacterized protein n=1 Tax=Thelephora terrestris TaxID=56493 RepID=A0A9P6H5V1_9AGAM|nr:hypothetical protein BJ322DRAFT_1113458 [Thelephora terrestris]
MFNAPNPFPSTSPVQQPVVPDARRSIWEYKLIRSLQVNRTAGLLTHFPYYRPFAALDAGVTTPPFLLGADHQFLWNSDLTESVLATVYFSVSPAFYFPSPKVHLTTNVHTHCPALIVLWWDIPTELPYSIIEYLVHFEQLSGQDFEPFVQQLNQFCQDYNSPVHPYQTESPLSLDIPPPLTSTPGTPFKTRPDTRHPSANPLAPHKQSRPYPTLGNVIDRSATADPEEGFTDLGFRDFIQASCRVSRCKLARIKTNPYAEELLTRGVEFVTEMNETYNSILEASVTHTSNVGTMLMDELAYVQARVDNRKEDTKKLEEWKETAQDIMHGQEDTIIQQLADIDLLKGELVTMKDLVRSLVSKTDRLEDDRVHLTRRVSELTREVRDLQRRCQEPEVRVGEEEPMIPERAESPPAGFMVPVEGRLVPVDDKVIEIGEEEFYQNLGIVRRDTPHPVTLGTSPHLLTRYFLNTL